VPQSWPEAVLDAQVIAARSYAWHVMGLATFRGLRHLCDGRLPGVPRRGGAARTQRGTLARRGRPDQRSGPAPRGEPILARYFSTSGGRTYANEFVFPSSGPRPYLVGIADPYDALSPLHRWEVRFTHDEFNTILAAGQTLRRTVPFATVERLGRGR
jgi:stage II sporulation protein D